MSQDYTVAKELASLKEIKQSAEQRISKLSLNALNYVDDHRLHKSGGGTGGVKTANITIIGASEPRIILPVYSPAGGGYPEVFVARVVSVAHDDTMPIAIGDVLVPTAIPLSNVINVTGEAAIMNVDDRAYVYVTGDCAIYCGHDE